MQVSNKQQIVDSHEATRHSMCSKCFPYSSTHTVRRTRHWSIAW